MAQTDLKEADGTVDSLRLRRLFHCLCALVLCLQLCGGHLGVLQMVAWTGMVVNFARTDGLAEATRKTFDGQHKCSMCKAIDASREAEKNQQRERPTLPADWSKFGKELAFFEAATMPQRLKAVTVAPTLPEPRWLWPVDPVAPPFPPPRVA